MCEEKSELLTAKEISKEIFQPFVIFPNWFSCCDFLRKTGDIFSFKKTMSGSTKEWIRPDEVGFNWSIFMLGVLLSLFSIYFCLAYENSAEEKETSRKTESPDGNRETSTAFYRPPKRIYKSEKN